MAAGANYSSIAATSIISVGRSPLCIIFPQQLAPSHQGMQQQDSRMLLARRS